MSDLSAIAPIRAVRVRVAPGAGTGRRAHGVTACALTDYCRLAGGGRAVRTVGRGAAVRSRSHERRITVTGVDVGHGGPGRRGG